MDNIVFGRYISGDSALHRMDPRAKILAMLFLIISIFIPSGIFGYVFIGIILLDGVFLAKLSISYIFKAMKPMMFMMFFLLLVNVFVIRNGDVLFTVFDYPIYEKAVFQTFYIVIRLLFMITITTLLTATTKPLELTLGIEDLLSPFKRIGVPAHIIAMMISIALRYIPTLIEETQRIMKAQASRGVDLEEGSFKEKISALLSLIIPLFISSFQRAEDLASAMEARGYDPEKKRTRYHILKMQNMDYLFVFFSILVLLLVILIKVVFYAI